MYGVEVMDFSHLIKKFTLSINTKKLNKKASNLTQKLLQPQPLPSVPQDALYEERISSDLDSSVLTPFSVTSSSETVVGSPVSLPLLDSSFETDDFLTSILSQSVNDDAATPIDYSFLVEDRLPKSHIRERGEPPLPPKPTGSPAKHQPPSAETLVHKDSVAVIRKKPSSNPAKKEHRKAAVYGLKPSLTLQELAKLIAPPEAFKFPQVKLTEPPPPPLQVTIMPPLDNPPFLITETISLEDALTQL